MASPENIFLHLSAAEEQQVRDVFTLLEERGFPAQKQKPHITVTFSPVMPDHVVQGAAEFTPAGDSCLL